MKITMKIFIRTLFLTIIPTILTFAQSDNWPCEPFNEQHWINGTFCENRISDDIMRHHFHDGVDIHLSEGGYVYSVIDGTVTSIGTAADYGINAFVRVGGYAYVHVDAHPSISVGDPVVAFETIVGTTNSWNHIHFKDGWPGSEINALRSGAGLDPFIDSFDPSIDYIAFYANNTTTQFVNNKVYGRIEIVARASDKSDEGPVGDNNGIYSIGYQIYDSSATIPLTASITNFVFDQIPASDSYITNVYFPGSDLSTYIYTITNNISSDGYWDTDQLQNGVYKVRVFSADTRQNVIETWETVEVTEPDIFAPAIPEFTSLVGNENNNWILQWLANDSSDVAGYELSFSLDGEKWTLHSEISNTISLLDTEFVYNGFPNNTLIYFRMNAYDEAAFTNYSDSSDAYGLNLSGSGPNILIVDGFERDGFERADGYWEKDSHQFVTQYGNILSDLGMAFNTCSAGAIRNLSIHLSDYPIVIYLLGDQCGDPKVLETEEQEQIKLYLQNGGKLMISGSEIGSDLNIQASQSDLQFYQSFLKSTFIADSAATLEFSGISGTVFDGYSGQVTPPQGKKYKSDVIEPLGSELILRFDDGGGAGIY
jgi:hypothetical protein